LKNTGVVIRDARPDEMDKVAEILKASYQQYEKFMPADAWQFYLADIVDVRGRMEDAQLIVAEVDGKLAASVTLYLKGRKSAESNWPAGWATGRLLGVDPAYRGKGIGRVLMDEIIRRCRKAGVKTFGLHTAEIMEVAKGMYERMGFQRVPEFDHHPRTDVVIMAYKLDL
jgi:GNAT superfamily N-acetyltransferase